MQPLFAQGNLTEEMKQKIISDVEKETLEFRQTLSSEKEDQTFRSFAMDTFRIERTMSKCMDIDYSTHGMLNAMRDAGEAYDRLLNKYYQLLLKDLKEADKVLLINAQKAWLKFRDEEQKLILKIHEDKYTGGGTMYQLNLEGMLLQRIQQRVFELFGMYDAIESGR